MDLSFIKLIDRKDLIKDASIWFSDKWGIPQDAYYECMNKYINGETKNGWYLCLNGEEIVGGLGVIDNDFHERTDLSPNVCAVFVLKQYRNRGIAGKLLNLAVEDMKSKGISPLYLVTDHTSFYERYGWEFCCEVNCDDGEISRLYKHY
jgi:GNAT superfamily N-acetyltransferase